MRRGAIAGVALLATLLGCHRARHAPTPVSSADYAVYDAVLDAPLGSGFGFESLHVVRDSIDVVYFTDDAHREFLPRMFEPGHDSLVARLYPELLRRSAVRSALDLRAFHTRRPVVSSRDQARSAGPPRLRNVIGFSRPAFDAEDAHALVAYTRICGALCGDTGLVLLERRAGRWAIIERVITGYF